MLSLTLLNRGPVGSRNFSILVQLYARDRVRVEKRGGCYPLYPEGALRRGFTKTREKKKRATWLTVGGCRVYTFRKGPKVSVD